jgi:hypothetical protein
LSKTNRDGIPDLLLLKDGKASFVEVKRPGCYRTPLQQKVATDLMEFGCNVRCVTLDDMDVVEPKPKNQHLGLPF